MALFITFEGIEGSGKTTQIKRFSGLLKSLKIKHVLTREPGGTKFGDKLRKLILVPKFKAVEAPTELFIMLAARCHHVAKVIKRNLARGNSVICDRFTDATIAYQGGGRGLDIALIKRLNNMATFGIKPDLTFLFDLKVNEGLKRAKKRLSLLRSKDKESRFENEALGFHERVRKEYLKLYRADKKRIKLIDASKNKDAIADEIGRIFINELKRHRRTR